MRKIFGLTITYASSRDYLSYSCTNLSEANKVVLFYFPKTQNQVHLLLTLHHFLYTSATISHYCQHHNWIHSKHQKKLIEKAHLVVLLFNVNVIIYLYNKLSQHQQNHLQPISASYETT
jgi:hypothetical protein